MSTVDSGSESEDDDTPQVIIIDRPTFDPDYACHLPGIARLTESIASLGAFVCVVFSHYGWYGVYISCTVSVTTFTASLTLFLMHLFHTVELTSESVNWTALELVYSGLWSIFTLISLGFVLYGAIRWRSVTVTWGISAGLMAITLLALIYSAYQVYRQRQPRLPALPDAYQLEVEEPHKSRPKKLPIGSSDGSVDRESPIQVAKISPIRSDHQPLSEVSNDEPCSVVDEKEDDRAETSTESGEHGREEAKDTVKPAVPLPAGVPAPTSVRESTASAEPSANLPGIDSQIPKPEPSQAGKTLFSEPTYKSATERRREAASLKKGRKHEAMTKLDDTGATKEEPPQPIETTF